MRESCVVVEVYLVLAASSALGCLERQRQTSKVEFQQEALLSGLSLASSMGSNFVLSSEGTFTY